MRRKSAGVIHHDTGRDDDREINPPRETGRAFAPGRRDVLLGGTDRPAAHVCYYCTQDFPPGKTRVHRSPRWRVDVRAVEYFMLNPRTAHLSKISLLPYDGGGQPFPWNSKWSSGSFHPKWRDGPSFDVVCVRMGFFFFLIMLLIDVTQRRRPCEMSTTFLKTKWKKKTIYYDTVRVQTISSYYRIAKQNTYHGFSVIFLGCLSVTGTRGTFPKGIWRI